MYFVRVVNVHVARRKYSNDTDSVNENYDILQLKIYVYLIGLSRPFFYSHVNDFLHHHCRGQIHIFVCFDSYINAKS